MLTMGPLPPTPMHSGTAGAVSNCLSGSSRDSRFSFFPGYGHFVSLRLYCGVWV